MVKNLLGNMEKKITKPLKFNTVEELEDKIQEYFDSCFEHQWVDEYFRDEEGNRVIKENGRYKKVPVKKLVNIKPLTITGLAVHLDTSRQTLVNYEKREKYFDAIKRAKAYIEAYTESCLFGNNVTGVIFNLKNNYGWKDRTEIDHSSGGEKIEPIKVEIVTNENKGDNSIPKELEQQKEDNSQSGGDKKQ